MATKFLPLVFTILGGFLAFLAFNYLANVTFTLTFHPLEDLRVVDVQLALLLRPLGVVRYYPYSHLLFSLGIG